MGIYAFIAVGCGAAVGAWLRWWFSLMFNPAFPQVPLGTLAANLLGGFLMGLAMAYIQQHSDLPAPVRLAITTGFLGGLTTFSTFSAETVTLLLEGEALWTFGIIVIHVLGSLAMTVAGIYTMRFLSSLGAS